MSDSKTTLYNNPGLQQNRNRMQTANTWEGAYNQAVQKYTVNKDYLGARQLLNMIRKTYPGKFNEQKISQLEGKIKSRIGL